MTYQSRIKNEGMGWMLDSGCSVVPALAGSGRPLEAPAEVRTTSQEADGPWYNVTLVKLTKSDKWACEQRTGNRGGEVDWESGGERRVTRWENLWLVRKGFRGG